MKNYLWQALQVLRAIAKRLTVLAVSVGMLLGLAQAPVLAASQIGTHQIDTKMPLDSSQGADQMTDGIPAQLDSPAKEERREWQSEVSSVREDENAVPSTLSEKLNLDELAKGFDPEREAEKRAVPTP